MKQLINTYQKYKYMTIEQYVNTINKYENKLNEIDCNTNDIWYVCPFRNYGGYAEPALRDNKELTIEVTDKDTKERLIQLIKTYVDYGCSPQCLYMIYGIDMMSHMITDLNKCSEQDLNTFWDDFNNIITNDWDNVTIDEIDIAFPASLYK